MLPPDGREPVPPFLGWREEKANGAGRTAAVQDLAPPLLIMIVL